jgi:protein-tyrosine kinase
MSSLIEQAAKRLEQLRGAGVAVPEPAPMARSSVPAQAEPVAAASPVHATTASTPHSDEPAASSRRVEINLAMLESAGIVTPNAPRSHIADEFRVIKRPLISNAVGRGAQSLAHGNLIMVTSAMPGEGKSFTALNLAMSIAAELDHTVMLVDADVARPSILRMLGLPDGPGLLDLLEGKAEMANVMLKTSIDKLTILPSGTPHPRATELLASDAMRLLLEDISKRYPDRIVIFDSPPLILTTEARVLATQMGQVVLVVQAEKTLQADVQHALSTIESCPVKMMLLNRVRADSKGSYAYGYGYGYGSEKKAA